MEQYKNKLGAEWQKFKEDMISWKPEIPKNIAMHNQEKKKTQSSKKTRDFITAMGLSQLWDAAWRDL